ncbi:AraC family transcriptional regulator [Methylocystis sp. IM3]|uniref:helix-turn-helix domain-containing protein n=1 Tax=unclassified Methylocystis TaxID=2625913 RepID=UPI0030F72CEF
MDIQAFANRFREVSPSVLEMDAVPADGKDPQGFEGFVSAIEISSQTLVSACMDPVKWSVKSSDHFEFHIPFIGGYEAAVGGKRIKVEAGRSVALLVPDVAHEGVTTQASFGIIRLKREQLVATIRAMSWAMGVELPMSRVMESSSIAADAGSINFRDFFSGLFNLVDECRGNQSVLNRMCLDDVIARAMVSLIYRDRILIDAAQENIPRMNKNIDTICEHIRNHPERWVSKTEMERLTGISGRAIQYGFQKRYFVGPMEWQKREKLRLARQLLLESGDNATIGSISDRLGFSSPSRFTIEFRKLFGESPSGLRNRRRAS